MTAVSHCICMLYFYLYAHTLVHTHTLTHTHTHTHRRNVSFHAPAGIFTSAETFGANGKPATREFSAWTSSTTLTSGGGRSWAKRCVSASLRTLLERPVCRPARIRVRYPQTDNVGACALGVLALGVLSLGVLISYPNGTRRARRWHVQS